MKILAIDGNSIINRAFYGIKLLSTKDGRYTNAVYGFINILLHLIEEHSPDGVAVAWDLKKPTFRHEMYKEYKAGRHAMPDELREQIPVMKEIITLMGFASIECEGYEADDILGTLAGEADKNGDTCIIATGDRDSLQLISDQTRVVLSATKAGKPESIVYDKAALFSKYSMTPEGMIELKSLMGDSSDNIPGVAGIGEKTATALITAYGNIDYIYENLDTLDIKDGIREKLRAGRENAYLSRTLGTICKEAPIDRALSNYITKPRDEQGLYAIMNSLELYKTMDRLGLGAQQTLSFSAKSGECIGAVEFKDFECSDKLYIIWDDSIYLCSGNNVTVTDLQSAKPLLENEKIEKWVYDYKNFHKKCASADVKLENVIFDSLLAGYLLSPAASEYSLTRLAREYDAPIPGICSEDETLKAAALHKSVCETLIEKLAENAQLDLLLTIELPLAKVLGDMETEGFLVDADGIRGYSEELGGRIEALQNEIFDHVGYEFNLNSPKQLGIALFEDLGFAVTPWSHEKRGDIIQCVTLGSAQGMIAFCQGMQ
ncbi:MAG: 5'-3' exonuclease H3TH domain-containing protein, partial [Acutalibacteraceae bacterium]|nr:5'-3' exonuclease H3TH domain-containing protein [Acutalibacteraceae bacterium]